MNEFLSRSLNFSSRKFGNVLILGSPYSYIYVVGDILIDTGTGYWGRKIAEFIERKGLRIERILFTHSHYDHVGGYTYVKDLGEHASYAHPYFWEVMRREKVIRFIEDMNRKEMEILGNGGNYTFTPPKNGVALKDGQKLEWEKGTVEVIFTPGHTRDSVSYYILPDKVMIPGEAAGVYNLNGSYVQPEFLISVELYLQSIKRLKGYDIEMIGLPHVRLVEGKEAVEKFFNLSEEITKRYVDKLKEIYETCEGEWECIKKKALNEIYEKNSLVQPLYAFFANLKAQVATLTEKRV